MSILIQYFGSDILIKDCTFFFTFVCENDIRREYIKIAINTLFQEYKKIDIPVMVVDGSSKNEFIENRKIFKKIKNLSYIHDEQANPFKRCHKYLDFIKTNFVLRLLEDAAFLNFSKNDFSYIEKDINLLKSMPNIDVVHYLMVDDNKYLFKNNILSYLPINFNNKVINYYNNYPYYSHSQNGFIYHYLCNNLLYRKDLILKQWAYLAENYLTHNDAEAGNINRKIYKLFSRIRYIRGLIRLFYRFSEKIFKRDSIIKSAVITQTSLECDALHIGYYRVETNDEKYSNNSNDIELKNLDMFNQVSILKVMQFKRYKLGDA
jgi:hypothetical protein